MRPTVAADVPSGLDASTGKADGLVVRAALTATNHAPKVGLHVGTRAFAGRIEVVDIGIPPSTPARWSCPRRPALVFAPGGPVAFSAGAPPGLPGRIDALLGEGRDPFAAAAASLAG